jgi:anti-anti-sigma factor
MPQTSRNSPAPLELTVSKPRSDVVVLSLRGELDLRTIGQVSDCLHELRHSDHRHSDHRHLVIDLTAVTFMAAAGAAVLLAARNTTRNTGRDTGRDTGRNGSPTRPASGLHLLGVAHNRPVHRVLEVLGVQMLFSTFTDLQECLDQL